MADYSDLFTGRYKLKYNNNGKRHTALFRFPSNQAAAPDAPQLLAIGAYFEALTPVLCSDFAIIEGQWLPANGRIALPAGVPGFAAAIPAGNIPNTKTSANQINFVGKSAKGSKARFMVIGTMESGLYGVGANYVYTGTEVPWLAPAIEALESIPNLVAIDSETITFTFKANTKPHDYWVKRARGG